MKVAVIGAGSWGTTVASLVSSNADVALWARDGALAEKIRSAHENPAYLPGIDLPRGMEATADLEVACAEAEVVVVAVPSHGFRTVLGDAAPFVDRSASVISVAKGIEQGTLARMTEIVREVLPDQRTDRIGVLTGPNLAVEVAEGKPTASVVAVSNPATAMSLQQLFMTPKFRVYTNPDVVGCEVAGALKNVIAIAAGIAAALDLGDNAMAALLTRGLAELTRLGVAIGGSPLTFAGLAGMGDLVLTCTSAMSRNRHVGYELGRGRALEDVVAETSMVAEGVRTTEAVLQLAERHQVEMPIARSVGSVLYEARDPADAVLDLMLREAKPELHGFR